MPCALVVIKRFSYRGNANEEFSNRYALSGAVPADSTAWRALFDALVAQEKTCYISAASVVRGYGYADDDLDENAVWSVDLTASPNTPVAGTAPTTGGQIGPGDTAHWVRWKLDKVNSRGKSVYLRKYFHPAVFSTGSVDQVASALAGNLNAFGAKMRDGSFLDARHITDNIGTATIGHSAGTYVTTRTLKRRGKRLPT